MKTKKSFILSIIITILTTIVLFASEVNATTYGLNQADTIKDYGKIGDIVQLNGGFSRGRNDTFCFEHKTGFSGGQYKVTDIIEINGRTAKSIGTGKTVVKKANVIMNYILFKGNYRREMYLKDGSNKMSSRNIAIWSYKNTWLNALGDGFLKNNWKNEKNKYSIDNYFSHQEKEAKEAAKKLRQEAINFSNNSTGEASAEITGAKEVSEYAANTYGPFKAKVTGDSVSLTVTGVNGTIAGNKIRIYSDKACTKQISKIKSNSNFYIKVTDGTKIKNVTVNASSSVLSARILFLAKNDFWSGNGGKGHGQGIILIKPGETRQNKSVKFNVKSNGNLTIQKVDSKNTKTGLIAGFKIQTSEGWLSGNNGHYTYNNSFGKGETYYTVDNSKSILINNGKIVPRGYRAITLWDLKFGKYKIWEVISQDGYDLSAQNGYKSIPGEKNKKGVYFGTATVSLKTTSVTKTYKNKKTVGNLTIRKVDRDTKKEISAGFKIKTSEGWLSGKNGAYNYKNSFKNAQVYPSTITLKNLKYGTYRVYEVTPPNGYDLSAQQGYDKKNNWVDFGTAVINSKNTNVTKQYNNQQKISIKGYVWIDQKTVKSDTYNSLYDPSLEAKSRVAGVKVRLKDKKTKKAIKVGNKDYVLTNANGEYIFDKLISQSQLKDYYVEFDYSGLNSLKETYKDAQGKEHKYIKYIPVAFNSAIANQIVKNGSRAIMDNVAVKDVDLKGIATTYKGTKDETTYGLSGNLFNKLMEGAVLNNINLGIKEIPKANYSLSENLEYVKINIRGFDYTYRYGMQGDTSKVAAPTVNWQKVGSIRGYTANIYPSEIVYKSNNSNEELKVDVGYRIDITNTNVINDANLYKENALHISKLTNTFDNNRYTLNDGNWKAEGNNTAQYNKPIADIGVNKTATVKINFSVNRKAIDDILEHPNGIIEKYPTTVNSIGYHKYTRNDYSWEGKTILKANQQHQTIEESRSSSAPYLIFRLGEERVISGRVFEDRVVTNDGQKLGNGVYDNGEKAVSGVKVELLDISGNIANINTLSVNDINKLNVSQLYRVINTANNTKKAVISTAMAVTDEKGEYTFGGVVPGYYFLRFTYGNGKQEIKDLEGNTINKEWISKIDGTEIDIKNYKSTIVKNESAKNGLKNGNDSWYRLLGDVNSSVAVDNLNTRIAVNSGTLQNIMAGTAKLAITVENSPNNSTELKGAQTQAQQEISDGNNTANVKVEYLNETLALNKFEGLNLGIIEMPKQEAKLEKIITNIKLTNTQNNLEINGNPETDKLQGVSDLGDMNNINGGSSYVRAELLDELIYGSTLELTYAIKVTNISDVNYYNNEYYYFGEADPNKEVTLVVNELVDYLDETLQFDQEKSSKLQFEVVTDSNLSQDDELAKTTVIKLNNWNSKLYTEKNTARANNNVKTSDSATIVAHRIIPQTDEDLELLNRARLIKVTNGTGNSSDNNEQVLIIKPTIPSEELTQARMTIVPPTGADRQMIIIYTVAGVVALAMLSAGVVVIKKYAVK